jgi:NSS family neurotransmitter:Na+ symporter
MSDSKSNKDQFSSLIGFLLVGIGFAVGVGSLWRFPYVCGSNGGAVFILAYLVVIVLVGIPLLTAEISIGFSSKQAPIKAYQTLAPEKKWYFAAYLHIIAALFIFSYTIPIYAWILNYLFQTATGELAGMDSTALEANFGTLVSNKGKVFGIALIDWAINILIVRGGLEKGLERVCKILLPILAIIMIIIIYNGLQMPGAGKGVAFLLKPDFSKFTFQSLLTALGQAFFAIGIGMLASMVFGSYIKSPRENICKCSTFICLSIIVAGLGAGFMIFPMVFAFGLEPAAGPGLTFISLPNVFNQISGGRFIGTLFYTGFYIAAITSSAGVFEAIVCSIKDRLNVSRNKALVLIMIPSLIIGISAILSDSFFTNIDILTSNYIIVAGAFIISIFVGWFWGMEKFLKAVNIKSNFIKVWLTVCIKYVSPIAILIIFIGSFI